MEKEKLLISSCFLGELVKYNGHHNKLETSLLEKLQEKYILYPVCPEVNGGLETPRVPCEIISLIPLKVENKEGIDKTKEFITGAKLTLAVCKKNNISKALLKANSPSCGNRSIYDGSFSGKKIKSQGVTARLLSDNKITVFNEEEIEKVIY